MNCSTSYDRCITMKKFLNIRPLENSEIALANSLVPVEWNFSLLQFYNSHPERDSYRIFGAFIENKLVGFGDVVINGHTGWLANIVINSENRTRGYGQAITMFLLDYLKTQNCRTILTMTNDANRVNYQKLGFLTSSVYCVLKGSHINSLHEFKYLRRIDEKDREEILRLDSISTNEDRSILLNGFVSTGWVYENPADGGVEGFYLPGFCEGPVTASNTDAGLKLLQLKHSLSLKDAILPCDNKAAVDFLKKNHFREKGLIHRMVIGEDLDWKQEMIFSRAGRFGA